MSKKSILASLSLITIGIIVGALLVSNIGGNGVDLSLAGGNGDVHIGGPTPVTQANLDLQAASESFVAVAKAVTPSVVSITVTSTEKKSNRNMPRDFFHFFGPDFRSPEPERSQGAGSGVVITADGYIVTNNHVVEGADEGGIDVVLNNTSSYKAKLIGTDPSTDLAVIKIEGKDLPVAALGNSDDVQVGQWVLAIGNPLGLTSTVTAGIVSALGRNIGIIQSEQTSQGRYDIENFIQTDAAINPGNSGGALVNIRGEVVGINTAIATTNARYQGYGFAVPSNLMKSVVADLIKVGKVRRGYIGVSIGAVDQRFAAALGMEKAQGVMISELTKGGAAREAGLKEKDVILSIDGREVNQPNEVQSYVATHHPGDVVILKVFRDGKIIEKKVTLKERDEESITRTASDTEEKNDEAEPPSPKVTTFESLGLSVRSLTDEEKKSNDITGGAVVSKVEPYGEAFNRRIGANDIVIEADKKQVDSPGDLKKVIAAHKPGDSILLRLQRGDGLKYYAAVQIPKN